MISPIQITFRNVPHSDAIEAFVHEQSSKLDKYYNHIMSCRVVVELPHRHHREGLHNHVRIDLKVPEGRIVVKREPTLHGAYQVREVERCTKCMELETAHKHLKVAIREAFDTARRELQDYARRQRADVKSHEPQPKGRVSRLFPDEGYGYIEAQDGREIYFHRNSVLRGGFKKISLGMEVSFVEEAGDKGPQASSVRIPGGTSRQGRSEVASASPLSE